CEAAGQASSSTRAARAKRTLSTEEVLQHERDVRWSFRESAHVPRVPVLAVADEDADPFAALRQTLLLTALDAVEHRVFVRRLRDLAFVDECAEPILKREVV